MSVKSNDSTTATEQNIIDHVIAFWQAQRKGIYTSLIILIVVGAAVTGTLRSKAAAKAEAQNAFQVALASNLNNPANLLVALTAVADEYSSSEYGAYAAFLIAQQKLSENNAEEALTWFDTVLATKKAGDFIYAESIEGKGVALEALGRNDEAMKEYIKVLSLKEGAHRYPSVSLKLALMYKAKGNNEAALKQFKEILTYDEAPVEIVAIAQKEVIVLK